MEPASDLKLTDYDESGVDLTLIRWFLTLTPSERLAYLEDHVWAIAQLRDAATKTKASRDAVDPQRASS